MSTTFRSTIPEMMQAAVLQGPHDLAIARVPVPEVAAGEVLVAVEATGLCGSDIHFYTGERTLAGPMVLGHEIAGRIVATGADVPLHRLDERVAVEPNIPCGDCPQCSRGLGRICARKQTIGQTRWGGLAEYVSVPQAFAWRIPDSMPLADAATIEPAAVAMHVISRAEAGEGSVVAIVGCGGIGLMVAAAALASGYRVVAIELNEHRRNAALSAGVERLSDARDAAAAHEFFVEAGVTVIIECAGLAATAQLCLDAAPRGSRIVLVGLATGDVTLNPLRFVRAELDVRGALIYDHPADFASTIDLVVAGRLSPGRNTATPAPLRELPAIFAAMETGTFRAKPLISPQIST